MSESCIVPGDWVVYFDTDMIEWGPWRVIHISRNKVRVKIDNWLACEVNLSRLEKIRPGPRPG